MSKKDYIKFADKIKFINNVPLQFQEQGLKNTPQNVEVLKEFMTWEIGEVLASDNYNFDWSKWTNYIHGKELDKFDSSQV